MEQPKATTGGMSVRLHYATMAVLIISNVCVLGLAMLFAASYGNAVGDISGKIEIGQAHAAIISTQRPTTQTEYPFILTGNPYFGSSVRLWWTTNADYTIAYNIERSDDGVTGWSVINKIPSSGYSDIEMVYEDNGLQTKQTYFYRVNGVGENGPFPYSNVISVTTREDDFIPPPAPTNLKAASVNCNSALLTWNESKDDPNGSGIWRYFIVRDATSLDKFVKSPATKFYDTFDPAAITHTYRVYAQDFYGNEGEMSVPATMSTSVTCPVAPPSDLRITGSDQNHIALQWQDSSINETGFVIFRAAAPLGTGMPQPTEFATTKANVATFNDQNVQRGYQYAYQVFATKNGSISTTGSNNVYIQIH